MTEIEKIKADIRALRIVVYGICVYWVFFRTVLLQ